MQLQFNVSRIDIVTKKIRRIEQFKNLLTATKHPVLMSLIVQKIIRSRIQVLRKTIVLNGAIRINVCAGSNEALITIYKW